MISVFHPSLLFCTKINWENPQFQRDFVKNLTLHLDRIEELKIKIALSNEFFSYFWQNSPWRDSYYENDIVDYLYPKLSSLFDFIPPSCNIECNVNPDIINDVSEEIRREWSILIHRVLHIQTKMFMVIGLNYNFQDNSITVSCNCECNRTEGIYLILKYPSDWFAKIDYMEKCPCDLVGWEDNFKIAILLCHEQEFKLNDFITAIENIEFSGDFKKIFIDLDIDKRKRIIKNITKLLTLTHPEAGCDGGLQEKNITGIYEIRISRGDRVFYKEQEGKKLFFNYTPASKHN